MVSVVVFEFIGMRCQPLRRALGLQHFESGGRGHCLVQI
ncbi:hypothetical protein MS6_A0310 [Vibrio cholerae MS6]|nr:hypothetical protein MS6_A0310 [Vibrio cholerae MS6]